MLDPKKLKILEGNFLMQYPLGFADPEMVKIGKKHNVGKLTEQSKEFFSKQARFNVHVTAENMIKVVSRSSIPSYYKPTTATMKLSTDA